MPRGFLGLNAALCETYMHFIAKRRRAPLGFAPVFPEVDNPFPWISEADGPEEREELLREPRDRVSERWRACLGLRRDRGQYAIQDRDLGLLRLPGPGADVHLDRRGHVECRPDTQREQEAKFIE